jgi:hypothetical protein
MTPELRAKLESLNAAFTPCGSRITCDPPPTDSDEDWLVLLPDQQVPLSNLVAYLSDDGWTWEGNSQHYQQMAEKTFMSWRKGDVNLIITKNVFFAQRHTAATHVCKTLNLKDKSQRIMVFQAVLYANVKK